MPTPTTSARITDPEFEDPDQTLRLTPDDFGGSMPTSSCPRREARRSTPPAAAAPASSTNAAAISCAHVGTWIPMTPSPTSAPPKAGWHVRRRRSRRVRTRPDSGVTMWSRPGDHVIREPTASHPGFETPYESLGDFTLREALAVLQRTASLASTVPSDASHPRVRRRSDDQPGADDRLTPVRSAYHVRRTSGSDEFHPGDRRQRQRS